MSCKTHRKNFVALLTCYDNCPRGPTLDFKIDDTSKHTVEESFGDKSHSLRASLGIFWRLSEDFIEDFHVNFLEMNQNHDNSFTPSDRNPIQIQLLHQQHPVSSFQPMNLCIILKLFLTKATWRRLNGSLHGIQSMKSPTFFVTSKSLFTSVISLKSEVFVQDNNVYKTIIFKQIQIFFEICIHVLCNIYFIYRENSSK